VLQTLLHGLNETAFSTHLRESDWTFSLIETVHVLSIAVMAGTIAIVDLRLMGALFRQQRVSQLTAQVTPVTWAGFVLMVLSGILLFVAQPEKNAANPAFQAKAVLLLLAGLNLVVFHRLVFRDVEAWDERPKPPLAVRLSGGASLALWATIIVLGRLIAYFPETVA
jgi:ABC-type multidrug transport system fused ATPase/permease subunit